MNRIEKIAWIIGIFVGIYLFHFPSNPVVNFMGHSESYDIYGQNLTVKLKGESFNLYSDRVVFFNVRNISVSNQNAEPNFIGNSKYIQVNFNENESFFSNDVFDANLFFDNITINKKNDHVEIKGYIPKNYHYSLIYTKRKFVITNDMVNSIFINGEELKEFYQIYLVMDEESYIELNSGKFSLDADGVSEINIKGQILKYFTLGRSEGILTLEDHSYNIKNTDTIDIIFDSKNQYNSEIEYLNAGLYGNANSAKLNGNDIIISKISYWFDQEPEKINALAAFVLAIITLYYVYITKGILKQTEVSVKQTEKIIEQTKSQKRFDNNETLLMHVYSPMDVILLKFKLSLDYISQSKESDEIPDRYNMLFDEMNNELLEIKRNYGYLFDNDLTQCHDEVWKLWKQYLNIDNGEKKKVYATLNSRVNALHNLVNNKITDAKKKREKINQNIDS